MDLTIYDRVDKVNQYLVLISVLEHSYFAHPHAIGEVGSIKLEGQSKMFWYPSVDEKTLYLNNPIVRKRTLPYLGHNLSQFVYLLFDYARHGKQISVSSMGNRSFWGYGESDFEILIQRGLGFGILQKES